MYIYIIVNINVYICVYIYIYIYMYIHIFVIYVYILYIMYILSWLQPNLTITPTALPAFLSGTFTINTGCQLETVFSNITVRLMLVTSLESFQARNTRTSSFDRACLQRHISNPYRDKDTVQQIAGLQPFPFYWAFQIHRKKRQKTIKHPTLFRRIRTFQTHSHDFLAHVLLPRPGACSCQVSVAWPLDPPPFNTHIYIYIYTYI